VDAKGRALEELRRGVSVPGTITVSFGGAGRNIAENLARLGQPTILLSAVGRDPFGAQILEHTAAAGVDVQKVIISPEHHSAAYLAITERAGTKLFAIDEMEIMSLVTPAYITANRGLFKGAAMVVLDGNLSRLSLAAAIRIAKQSEVPVAVDPASATLAHRLLKHLRDLAIVRPNVAEAAALVGHEIHGRDGARAAAQELIAAGVGTAIVSLAEEGLCYATARGESGYIPAIQAEVVDYTGAGDALTAAVLYGLVNHFAIDEAMRLGVSAATLTLKCVETVCPDLTLERLYDQLVI
jgi:pseudouridine kinase